jgi:hypothetical protein
MCPASRRCAPTSAITPLVVAGDDPAAVIALAGMLAILVGLIEIGLGVGKLDRGLDGSGSGSACRAARWTLRSGTPASRAAMMNAARSMWG